jgi:heat shock protein HtpX
MHEVPLLGEELVIDICPETKGVWFDNGELKKLARLDKRFLAIQLDTSAGEITADANEVRQRRQAVTAGLGPLPNLYFRSTMTLFMLYAVLGLVLITLVEFDLLGAGEALAIGISIAVAQFLFGPALMDWSLKKFYTMNWVKPDELPEHLQKFVKGVCEQSKMRFPRFGLIHDGSPNAFTYGHTPNNARIVITKGILDLLDEKAVVAHEIGHAKHWDMFFMTIAQLVPLVLYFVYRKIIDRKGSPYELAAAIVAYVIYIVLEYIVLWFSRTREYHADRFAGQVTGQPNNLASALVKIAYGLAGQEKKKKKKEKEEEKEEKEEKREFGLEAIGAFGIFDPGVARSLAVASYARIPGGQHPEGGFDKTALLGTMRWDLWNPWARYYELNSTHPLVANRLTYLGEQAISIGQEPYVLFNLRKPESYWDEFLMDFSMLGLPLVTFSVLVLTGYLTGQSWLYGVAMMAAGVTMIGKLLFSHPRKIFPVMRISGLLRKVKVSGVRAVPCQIKGRVIGRGVPGLIWSEDFVMRDGTGIIFLDYRQPLRIWEFFFGLMRAEKLKDVEVEVTGWYRRSPAPYVELNTLKVSGRTRRCYVYYMRLAVACLLIFVGLIATLGWIPGI